MFQDDTNHGALFDGFNVAKGSIPGNVAGILAVSRRQDEVIINEL